MADAKISALTAATSIAGTEEIPLNQSGASKKATLLASVQGAYKATWAPAYVSGRWYSVFEAAASSPSASGASTLRLNPFALWAPVTISDLGCYVATGGSTATNILLGVYNSHATTGLPTTLAAGLTSAITGGTVGGAFSGTLPSNVALQPGIYWAAWLTDNAAVALQPPSLQPINRLLGSSTLANVAKSAAAMCPGISIAATYGSGLPSDLSGNAVGAYAYSTGTATWNPYIKVA